MRCSRSRGATGWTAGFVTAMTLGFGAAAAGDGPSEERCRSEPESKPCCQPAVGDWREFAELEVRDEELVLTNVSDRPIVAWTVRQVTRITEGNEGWAGLMKDAFGYGLHPESNESLLSPGESVTLDRPGEPWIRPDLKGPEYLVYYDVGALVFENAEWVGVPEVVDRVFESRLDEARTALKAMEVTASADAADASVLDDLPRWYRRNVESYATLSEALRAIHAKATEDYQVAVANLRPEDLAELQLEEEPPLYAMQTAEPLPEISPPPDVASEGPSPEDFAHLEVQDTEFVLTNISDRPINAWSVKTVMRSSRGHESWGATLTDAYRSPILPIGEEGLLQPGESISIEKLEQPPLGQDYGGPGAGVYYLIGALIFEGGEAVGDPQLVEDIFESRLEWARSALKALEVAGSVERGEAFEMDHLPPGYRRFLDLHSSQEAALRAVQDEALEEYTLAFANLRLQDLTELPLPEEVLE